MSFSLGEEGQHILEKAFDKSDRMNQNLTTLHLLLVFCEGDGLASKILADFGITKDTVRKVMKFDQAEPAETIDELNRAAQKLAERIPASFPGASQTSKIQGLHLLAALTTIEDCLAYKCLNAGHFKVEKLYGQVMAYLVGIGKRTSTIGSERGANIFDTGKPGKTGSRQGGRGRHGGPNRRNDHNQVNLPMNLEAPGKQAGSRKYYDASRMKSSEPEPDKQIVVSPLRWKIDAKQFPVIAQLGVNLNLKALNNELDELLGREHEIECLMDVLGRRKANNPILIGESGVGKTAIVEGLAQKIVKGEVDGNIASTVIMAATSSSLIGGTSIRGSLSEKIAALKKESARLRGRLTLFFDDAMEIIKSIEGGGEGVLAEIKETLAQGMLPSVFTATPASWKKMGDLDSNFSRCLTPIHVEEVGHEETLRIVNQLSSKYASYHGVDIDADACTASVNLSTRYLSGRKNPEKSLMVLDLAAARTGRTEQKQVTSGLVAQVVSSLTDVPIERLSETDGERLINLEKALSARVVGHGEAIEKIALTMRRNAAGFRGHRPIGSFLFLGPTGVGKTEMAKVMAGTLFGKDSAMLRFDMSEFSEAHSVSRLIGAPPGYVGFEKGGELTDAIIDHSYRLVLMDEFEKAHMAVHRLLLQLLEEGRLTDAHGRIANFQNCVIVLTSNIGSDLKLKTPAGFAIEQNTAETSYCRKMRERCMEVFSPELMNRIDESIVFSPLTRQEVQKIARMMLRASAATIYENRRIRITWDEDVTDLLIKSGGFDPLLGARPMRRTIQATVESCVADLILTGKVKQDGRITMSVENGTRLKGKVRNRREAAGPVRSRRKRQKAAGKTMVKKASGFE
ncbi:MAG: ATP-dependent Clp protease ATP-binding subunit [Pseudomonadota bacterium]